MPAEIDLQAPAVRADPYPTYARLRREAPVYCMPNNFIGRTWILSRYEDVQSVLEDHKRFATNRRALYGGEDPTLPWWLPNAFNVLQQHMLASDPPDHRRLRDLVHKAFTPRRIESLTASIEQIIDRLLSAAERKPQVDLIADFALPLPLTVISEMLGVPEQGRSRFHRWMAGLLDRPITSRLGLATQAPRMVLMLRMFRQMVRERREQPGEDLITALVQAREGEDRLSEDELVAMIFLLLLAGHETTVNLIANGTLALLEHPEQLQKLREHPELVGTAIEELLRFTNPVEQPSPRFAREDLTLRGQEIARGDTLVAVVASANRDEATFPNADTLDITRQPNRHLAFGMGIHYCLGAPLARLEGRLALPALLQRFPRLRLAVPREQLRWRSSLTVRGLKALPLHLT